jgi:hypothetical protein
MNSGVEKNWLGTNYELFAFPWESLKSNRGDHSLYIDKSVYKNAEGLDEGVWTLNYDKL